MVVAPSWMDGLIAGNVSWMALASQSSSFVFLCVS
jgi:hypothetical protein